MRPTFNLVLVVLALFWFAAQEDQRHRDASTRGDIEAELAELRAEVAQPRAPIPRARAPRLQLFCSGEPIFGCVTRFNDMVDALNVLLEERAARAAAPETCKSCFVGKPAPSPSMTAWLQTVKHAH